MQFESSRLQGLMCVERTNNWHLELRE